MGEQNILNAENKCAHLMAQAQDYTPARELADIFQRQLALQRRLAELGRGVNPETASFKERVADVTTQMRNLHLEEAELLERLPFKEWKTYPAAALDGFTSEEQRLETLFEYVDMLHFFVNIALNLGFTADEVAKAYAIKNQENFDRQARGY